MFYTPQDIIKNLDNLDLSTHEDHDIEITVHENTEIQSLIRFLLQTLDRANVVDEDYTTEDFTKLRLHVIENYLYNR